MSDESMKERERIKPPASLQPIIDAAVAHAYGEGPEPADIGLLHEWLNVDGWDALIADLFDEMALKIDYLADVEFSDGELRATVGKAEDEPITDAERIEYARDLISRVVSGDYDDHYYPSVHTYPLTDSKNRMGVLGCTVEIHGQTGPVPVWDGIFVNREAYLTYLVDRGCWLGSELDSVDDARVLAKWQGRSG